MNKTRHEGKSVRFINFMDEVWISKIPKGNSYVS
jgi:hypothetical protein